MIESTERGHTLTDTLRRELGKCGPIAETAEERRTRNGVTKVKIITIDYITDGRYEKHHSLEDMPTEVRLACDYRIVFASGREMEPWLKRVHNEFDLFVGAYTIECEECCYCETGQQLRRRREDEEREKGLPHRLSDGRIFFPETGPIKTKKKDC